MRKKKYLVILFVALMVVSLLAACNNVSYTITFIAEGQSDIVYEVKEGGSLADIPSVPEKTGYVGSWNINNLKNISADITVSAVYTPIQYGIFLNLNGGELKQAFIENYTIESNDVTLPLPEKGGSSFLGWYDNAQFNGQAVTEIIKGSTGNKDFYAKWQEAPQQKYNVSLTSVGNVDAVLGGSGEYYAGETVTVTAHSDEQGYNFIGWYEGNIEISKDTSYSFIMQENNVELTAKWLKTKYTVILQASAEGVTLIGGGEYEWGEIIIIHAEESEKYTFVDWKDEEGNLLSDNPSFEYEVQKKSVTLTAYFEDIKQSFNVSLTNFTGQEEAGSLSGGGEYFEGDEVNISAVPDTGYIFLGWFKDGIEVEKEADYTFTMPESHVEYTAKWEKLKYQVTVSGAGTEGSVTGEGNYEWGINVTLTATANEGYEFDGWWDNGNLAEAGTVYAFTMPKGAVELTAKWKVKRLSLSIEINIAGAGTLTGAGEYAEGESVTVSATANEGYEFKGWYEGNNEVSSSSEYTFDMPERELVYQARFEKTKYTLVVINSDSKKGTVSGGGQFEWGTSVTITATAKDGYSFNGWEDKTGKIESYDVEYIFDMPKEETSFTAIWQEGTEGLTYSLLSDGTYAVAGGGGNASNLIIPAIHKGKDVSAIKQSAFIGRNFDSLSFAQNSNILVIESNAFSGTIRKVIFPENRIDVKNGAFGGVSQIIDVSNYSFSYSLPLSRTSLQTISIIDNIVPESIFRGYAKLSNVVFINQISSIGAYSFASCADLSDINLTGITTIGSYAFSGSGLTEIILPESVTSLGDGAFEGCKNLTAAYINAQISELPQYIFSNAEKLSILILNQIIQSIGESAFSGCKALSGINFPQNLNTIGNSAFYGSGLTAINLPDGIWNIGTIAFGNCTKLESASLPLSLQSAAGILYGSYNIRELTAPLTDDIQTIESYFGMSGEASSLKTFTVNGGSAIGDNFFSAANSLEKINIGSTVLTISTSAFSFWNGTGLEAINVSDQNQKFTSVDGVLYSKDKTLLIKYPAKKTVASLVLDNVIEVGAYAFHSSTLTYVSLPKVQKVGDFAFASCDSLAEINFNCNTVLNEVGNYAFAYNNILTGLRLPASLSIIGEGVLYQTENLTSITVPYVGQYGNGSGDSSFNYLFKGYFGEVSSFDKITSVEILGGSVIGDYAFDGFTHIQTLTLPEYTLHTIGKRAFNGLFRVSNINIPYGVEYIGQEALQGMSAVSQLFVPDTVENIGAGAFASMSKLQHIRVPFIGTSETSGNFGTVFTVTALSCEVIVARGSIGDYAFSGFSNITGIDLPDTITYIGKRAFYGLDKMTTLCIPSAVAEIGEEAFSGMSSVKELYLPSSITYIGKSALKDMTSLRVLTVPFVGQNHMGEGRKAYQGFSYIFGGDIEFNNSHTFVPQSLENVTVLGGTKIIYGAFTQLSQIKEITLSEGIAELEQGALYGLSGLQRLKLPYIGLKASQTGTIEDIFGVAPSLQSLWIEGGKILADSLSGATFSQLIIGEAVTQIHENAVVGRILSDIIIEPGNLYYTSIDGVMFNKDISRLIKFPALSDITEYSIPDTVKVVGKYALYSANLSELIVPNSVEVIEENALSSSFFDNVIFAEGSRLRSIGNSAFARANINTAFIIPNSVISLGNGAFSGFSAESFEFEQGSRLQTIGEACFWSTSVPLIVLPLTVKYIGDGAFASARAEEIVVGFDMSAEDRYFGGKMFFESNIYNCLKKVTLPFAPERFYHMFSDRSYVDVPASLKTIIITGGESVPSKAFINLNNVTTIILPESIRYIGAEAFSGSGITSLIIPEGVQSIGDGALSAYRLQTLEIPLQAGWRLNSILWTAQIENLVLTADNYTVASDAFDNVKIQNILVRESNDFYSSIDGVLYNKEKTQLLRYPEGKQQAEFLLPDSILTINERAFYQVEMLKNIVFGRNVQQLNEFAFYSSSIESFAVDSANQFLSAQDGILYNSDKTILIRYPENKQDVEYVFSETLVAISQYAFYNNANLTKADFGGTNLKTIEMQAFAKSQSLKEIILSNCLEIIGESAFLESSVLSLNAPDTLYEIGESVFKSSSIKSVSFGENSLLKIIPEDAFRNSSLEEIVLPSGLESIGRHAFRGTKLKSIILPETLVEIGFMALYVSQDINIIMQCNQPPIILADFDSEEPDKYKIINTSTKAIIFVKQGLLSHYTAADGWKYFAQLFTEIYED